MSNFTKTSFEISIENIIQGKRRQSIGTVYEKREEGSGIIEETIDYTNMANDRVVTILGELGCDKEQMLDCLDTDLKSLLSIADVDEIKKEVKGIKANLQKSVSQLNYLKEDQDVSEYLDLVAQGKELISSLNERRTVLLAKSNQLKQDSEYSQEVKVFSHIKAIMSSLDLSLKRFNEKFIIDFESIENDVLIMLNDSISEVRDEYNDLSKLYHEITEKCPPNFPNRDEIFKIYNNCMTDAEGIKALYGNSIRNQMQLRELTRNKIKNTTNEIKLATFQGYGVGFDYYSFKSQFLNKYRRYTSADMVDILKNTYLKGEAYNTVKGLTKLEDIWGRLKEEFGNPCLMMKDKLSEILSITPFSKIRGVVEKSEAVLKMINLLTDLFTLADEHSLQLDLYCKNEKVIGRLLSQLPRLWLHDWQALKKSQKKEVEEKIKGAPAWKEDHLNWERFKSFLEDQLVDLKEESHIEDSLKDISIDDKCKKVTWKDSYYTDRPCGTTGEDDDYYEYEDCIDNRHIHTAVQRKEEEICRLCKQKVHKHYWDCATFMKMKHGERFELFINPKKTMTPKPHIGKLLGECAACLVPNEKFGHRCNEREDVKRWICPEAHQRPVHILCCRHHTEPNKHIWEKFQFNTRVGFVQEDEFIPAWKREQKWKNYVNTAKLFNHEGTFIEKAVRDEGLFLLQKVAVDNMIYNVFYDSGCSDFGITKSAVDRLGARATQVKAGTFQITGAGNVKSEAKHGIYEVRLPLVNGKDAQFVGLCMDEVTSTFCEYNMGTLYAELAEDYVKGGGQKDELPSISCTGICGGDTDIMIGIKYNRYLPRMIHQLESGLAVYRSSFQGIEGSTAVIGGPHPIISQIEREHSQRNNFAVNSTNNYLSAQLKLYLDGYDIAPDLRLAVKPENEEYYSCEEESRNLNFLMKTSRTFSEYEGAGTEVTYRCLRCRNCKDCKCGAQTEEISRKEESEQYCIERSVEFNVGAGNIECVLPLQEDPATVLGCNFKNATQIYRRWVSKINKNEKDLSSVLHSEQKLQTRGHVDYLNNLTGDQQQLIEQCSFKYFLPWRPVWNEDSLTTPCRITFDAGDKTDTGVSLNDILPKGINQINSLLEIIIRWRNGKYAMASDIEQMYNGVRLSEKHWPLQMYLWSDGLREDMPPEIKVIKTLIYGVRSSGNQAITGVKRVAKHYKNDYPDACRTLVEQIYVDDILPEGKYSLQSCYSLADELVIVLERGGLKLKRFAFSTVAPEPSLSTDGIKVGIAGMEWYTIADDMSLKTRVLNFAKKYRGKRPDHPECFIVPKKLTRRICTSKVGEIWDILGQFVPITARLKLDLHDCVIRNLKWDDEIPEELRQLWVENFKLIEGLDGIRFSRATVPADAIDLEMETIEAGDASCALTCVGVYVRFKRKGGGYSCELVAGKSKLVPANMSVPRAELYAAEINSALGHIVKRAYGEKLIKRYKITDSKIALYWINSWEKPLKMWTRNRVNEILRLSAADEWYWLPSQEMPCDIGTRRSGTLKDVGDGSQWKEGLTWMKEDAVEFPLKSFKEVMLETTDRVAYEKEIIVENKMYVVEAKGRSKQISEKISERLVFSKYILHPNKYRFKCTVRILGLVFHFLLRISKPLKRKLFLDKETSNSKFKHFCAVHDMKQEVGVMSGVLKQRIDKSSHHYPLHAKGKLPVVSLTELEVDNALYYLYKKATEEMEEFGMHTRAYKESVLIDGIRYWNGRLLESQKLTNPERHPMSSVMLDLSSTQFCVPIVDQYSPVAWSIIYEIHWYHTLAKHSGVATTTRISREYAYIAGVKEICQVFRKSCAKCRWIAKRTIEVEFGPLSDCQLTLAPAFYVTQIDLMGPYKAYQINVRATMKIWFAVFVCVVTSTVDIQVMEFYSTGSFISAFTRFASQNGYPKILLPDQGKNIESGARNVEIDWIDVKGNLHRSYGLEVETCGVGGHHQHGKVERKIRQIKETFMKGFNNVRISVLQWQTVAAETSNTINNLPIGTGSSRNINLELDDLDIITPNRLKLGRNNERSPLGPAYISNDPFKFIHINQKNFESWWEHWLTSAVPELVEKPVNWRSSDNIEEGDVVLFKKTEGAVGAGVYQYGIVQKVFPSKDGVIRNVTVRYRNFDERNDRCTKRAVKSLVLIHKVDELNILKAMAEASHYVDELYNATSTNYSGK